MDFLDDLANMANKPKPVQSADLPSEIHQLLMELKVSHYKARTQDFEHQAIGEAYEAVNDFADEITEKLMGYTGIRISKMSLAPVMACSGFELGQKIIALGDKITAYGETNGFGDIENLGQSFSGVGAQLRILTMP